MPRAELDHPRQENNLIMEDTELYHEKHSSHLQPLSFTTKAVITQLRTGSFAIHLDDLNLLDMFPNAKVACSVRADILANLRGGSYIQVIVPVKIPANPVPSREAFLEALAKFDFAPAMNVPELSKFRQMLNTFSSKGDSYIPLGSLNDKQCFLFVDPILQDNSLNSTVHVRGGFNFLRKVTLEKDDKGHNQLNGLVIGRLYFEETVTLWVVILVEIPDKGKELYALRASGIDEADTRLFEDSDLEDEDPKYSEVDVLSSIHSPVVSLGGLGILARDSTKVARPLPIEPLREVVAWSTFKISVPT